MRVAWGELGSGWLTSEVVVLGGVAVGASGFVKADAELPVDDTVEARSQPFQSGSQVQ
jgi:hypothetical protein